ncbi:hypothetical protein M3A49_40835 [Paraburkholderia sp. CNPSo 3076]|uniref:hypothetical protein n=1 Tax=Paraburkholderia sp. CNPSo 3076 TaxID=2940936 RepID=UPI00224EC574|nr:hypothetical protein [Paraburkholderia sp. CNPSo 3076]MCX5545694.1 hypothetical protein [Paraburkholderia sp. CNPSo 3076]
MSKLEWGVFIALMWAWDAHNRSQAGRSALGDAMQQEGVDWTAADGTNFTNSVWDPYSGQPTYMFGTINAPGGAGISPSDYSGAIGHF